MCSRKSKGNMIKAVSTWDKSTRKGHRNREGDRLYRVLGPGLSGRTPVSEYFLFLMSIFLMSHNI